ncbi:hypothetical protein CK203_033371 [Vitis vinifera]|uniref:Retrotransposon gag domain-containing protein n=1 Tax=Vitis vinifera TaxID=29760 RepID=A0A438HMU3_VITVI|nr:hypothetical protein CK203_033371 [Vitis vinifera]
MRASDRIITWEDFDGVLVANLPAKFRMPEIERYIGISCIHLRTWDDLAHEFLRQFAFNTVIDVSRRELEALKQRPKESITSFISHWREKISQIIDRPSEKDQISMILKSLQPRFARHLMGFPYTNFGYLVQALYGDVGAISSAGMRPLRRYQTVGQTSGFYYPSSPHVQYRPPAPSKPMTPTYLHPRPTRQFSQLGMPLSRAFQKFMEGGLLTQLAPKPLPQPIPPRFRMDFHCSYHQGLGHDTDHCTALRHVIHDLIDQVPPPLGDIHHIDLIEDDSIHMLSWDDKLPEPIILHDSCEADGVSLGLQEREIEIVTRSGRIAQPPPSVVRPFEGATSHDKVRREDDEVLRQLQSTQAHISIWRLLTSSSTHRDALIRALSHIKVETTTTLEGLIHMMTTDRVNCIVFSDDDLPLKGLDHVRPLYITVGCLGHKVPSILLDNGSVLNVFPLATAIAFGFTTSDFGPSIPS